MDDMTRQILTRARALIADVGWCQGENMTMDEHGKCVGYCVRGALIAAGARFWRTARKEIERVVDDDVTNANDAPTTTRETVLGWFDKALEA